MRENSQPFFERLSNVVTLFTSTSIAFVIAVAIIFFWVVSGFILHFGELWLSIIGAVTSVITFLMVFIIQKSQNKESKAIQLKLNELLAASTHASNRLVGIEELPEEELENMYEHFRTLVSMSYQKSKFTVSHSIEKAIEEDDDLKANEKANEKVNDKGEQKAKTRLKSDKTGKPAASQKKNPSGL